MHFLHSCFYGFQIKWSNSLYFIERSDSVDSIEGVGILFKIQMPAKELCDLILGLQSQMSRYVWAGVSGCGRQNETRAVWLQNQVRLHNGCSPAPSSAGAMTFYSRWLNFS